MITTGFETVAPGVEGAGADTSGVCVTSGVDVGVQPLITNVASTTTGIIKAILFMFSPFHSL